MSKETKTPNITLYALAAYNSGKLVPKTFNLWEYADYPEYQEAVAEWLATLGEEEWIVCDYEDVPECYVSEYDLAPEFFEFQEVADEMGYDCVVAGLSFDIPLDKMNDAFIGEYSSMENYAYELMAGLYDLDSMPAVLTCRIDWEGVAQDLSVETNFENGYVFSSSW